MISALILTKNEEHDIANCLSALSWCSDILVLDSFSDDNTVRIAESFGARVFANEFSGYASQRNFGLSLPFENQWVLIVDADEIFDKSVGVQLLDSVRNIGNGSDIAGFTLRRIDCWGESSLNHAQVTPYYTRLVRLGRARYEREINERLLLEGRVEMLSVSFRHYPFSKGLHYWIQRHNVYSTMEARAIASTMMPISSALKLIFSFDFHSRRAGLKGLFYHLPLRPVLRFLYMFVWRRSFLDGIAGVRYTLLMVFYEYLITLKLRELRRR